MVDALEARGHDVGLDLTLQRRGRDHRGGAGGGPRRGRRVIDAATQPLPSRTRRRRSSRRRRTTCRRPASEPACSGSCWSRSSAPTVRGRLPGRQVRARAGDAGGPGAGADPARDAVSRVRRAMVDWGRQGDVIWVPRTRTQLVAARRVAEELADLATARSPPPRGRAAIPRSADRGRRRLADDGEGARRPARRRACASRRSATRADPDHELLEAGHCSPAPTRPSPGRRSRSGCAPNAGRGRLSPAGDVPFVACMKTKLQGGTMGTDNRPPTRSGNAGWCSR